MTLRRFIPALLGLCLVLCLALPALAAEETVTLEEAITQACIYRQEADLADYKIPAEEFKTRFDALRKSGALPWYITGSYNYSYDTNTNYVLTFTPSVIRDGNVDMLAYEQKIAEILDTCVLPGMTDVQIALALHDYLAVHTVYDSTLEKNTCYDLIVDGISVCAGYAEAYQDLLLRVGIDCLYVSSDEMDHGWNLVCIDGNWYHVDVTWDDPSPDIFGRVRHTYFLLTDAEISSGEEPHYGWDGGISCTDTRFSDGWWRTVNGPICFDSPEICYLTRAEKTRNAFYQRDEQTGTEQLLYEEKDNYINLGQGSYRYGHQGLALRGGRLYFNTMDAVQYMDPATGEIRAEYVHGGNTYISGFHIKEDMMYLTLMDHESNITNTTQPLEPLETHIHSYTHTQTAPTCSEGGYTTSTCSCGITFQSTPVAPSSHTNKKAFRLDGIHYTCTHCGHTDKAPYIPEGYEFSATLFLIAGVLLLSAFLPRRRKRKS